MYNLILMAALTTGAETPTFGHHCGHCHSSCYGCSGGCYGGCYGGGYGCYGSCAGCAGAWYGCYGNNFGGCYGCGGYGGCYGCSGYGGCYGGCYGCYGYSVSPYLPVAPVAPGVPTESAPAPKKAEGSPSTRARLVIDVPQDAKLYIDEKLMKTASAHRSFSTPNLERGQAYYYDVRVEVVRDGKVISDTKRVVLRAGDVAQAQFPELGTAATASLRTAQAK